MKTAEDILRWIKRAHRLDSGCEDWPDPHQGQGEQFLSQLAQYIGPILAGDAAVAVAELQDQVQTISAARIIDRNEFKTLGDADREALNKLQVRYDRDIKNERRKSEGLSTALANRDETLRNRDQFLDELMEQQRIDDLIIDGLRGRLETVLKQGPGRLGYALGWNNAMRERLKPSEAIGIIDDPAQQELMLVQDPDVPPRQPPPYYMFTNELGQQFQRWPSEGEIWTDEQGMTDGTQWLRRGKEWILLPHATDQEIFKTLRNDPRADGSSESISEPGHG